jgi:hypothetical protein
MRAKPPPRVTTTRPATEPATQPAAEEGPKPPEDFLSLVKQHHPGYPATQPVSPNLRMKDAGRFVIPEPVYLDLTRGVLFVTRADAPPTAELLKTKDFDQRQVVITRERPVFVHWGLDARNDWHPCLIVPGAGENEVELVTRSGRAAMQLKASGYDWPRAFSINERVYVPTARGASAIALPVGEPAGEIVSPDLAEQGALHRPVQLLLDNVGVLAWVPPSDGDAGVAGAVRFVSGRWVTLTPQAWPQGVMHVIPLGDGNAVQLRAEGGGDVRLAMAALDAPRVDERQIMELVIQLSAPDEETRNKAYEKLAAIGPAMWPVAEKMMDGEPPETQARLKVLLKAKVQPLLGHMELLGRQMQLVARTLDGRLPEGGALLYAPEGVSISRGELEPRVVRPAWIHVTRGPSFELLEEAMVADLDPARSRFDHARGQWLVTDEVFGPRWYLAGTFYRLLKKQQREFSRFVGIDSAGRYLFQEPGAAPASAPATQPSTLTARQSPTLVIDPTLPDPEPRLPVWEASGTAVGWTRGDWAVIETASFGALGFAEWREVDRKKEGFFTKPEEAPRIPPYVSEGPATKPAGTQPAERRPAGTQPATTPAEAFVLSEQEMARPLLRDEQGTWYFNGRTSLKVISKDGTQAAWDLPAIAQGSDEYEPWLVKTRSGLLFLFNQPGRVLRLRQTPKGPEPFAIEATFAKGIPSTPNPTRIWLDPYGRIIVAHGTSLAVLFPDGYIPRPLMHLIPDIAVDEDVEE